MLLSRISSILLCVAAALSAQTSKSPARHVAQPAKATTTAAAPAMQIWPVGKLSVEGNNLYTDEQILAIAGLKVGQMAGKTEFDAARDRLLATAAFESVGYKFEPIPGTRTNAGTFQVDEITQLFPYRFEEIHVDEKALREHLKTKEALFGDKIPATQPVLDRFRKEVQAFAKLPEEVVARTEGTDNLTVVFRPGSLPSVAEISFVGNRAIPNTKLQSAVAGAGIGAVYTETRFRQILNLGVRPAYETLGYLHVEFPELEVTPARDVKGIAVKVHVKEGAVYKLADVQLKGELEEDGKALLKVGGFPVGDVANYEKIRTGVDDMRKALRRKGYIEAKTSATRTLDETNKTVTVTVTAEPGPQFTMGKLTIEGLDIETEPHIRKLWALKRGQPFDADYPNYFLDRLVADQIMDNLGKTSSSIAPDPERKTVDVTITLAGEKRAQKPGTP